MEYEKHRSCILNSCCVFFSVDTGAKIVGYIGVSSNFINIIYTIILIVALSGNSTSTQNPSLETTIAGPIPTTDIYYDRYLGDEINMNSDFSDGDDVFLEIILLTVGLVINTFNLSSNIVMLVGLFKRIAPYVKFGLVVGIVTLTVGLVITLGTIVATPSLQSLATLLNFVLPTYLLLVIRSAYYNMLDDEVLQPIYTFGQTNGKGPYQEF